MLKAAILGFGGISRAHLSGYQLLEQAGKAKLVAVCDICLDAFEKKIEINIDNGCGKASAVFNTYTDLEEMLEKEKPDMVDICLPSYLHKEYAVKMLRHGCHVLSEKPMALCYEDCLAMLKASEETGKQLMIGQCLHFFPEYEHLKEAIADGRFGKPKTAFLQRLSSPPVWGWDNWYMDENRSGGCIMDLHIHDVDIARYLFGEPDHISCRTRSGYTKWEMAHTVLCFGDMTATIIADWALVNFPFEAQYRVVFEKATVVCIAGQLTVYPDEGEKFSPQLSGVSGYAREIEYFVDTLINGSENTKNDPVSAAKTIRLIEALRESAAQGGNQISFEG